MSFDRTWVIIAAYNEGASIGAVVSEVRETFKNVIVVDDGSTDNTVAEAKKNGAHIIQHPINLGQGAALQTGMSYANMQNAEFIVTFDADGQHSILDVMKMLNEFSDPDLDVVCGSRFLGSVINMPSRRRLLLKLAVLFTRATSGLGVTDAHNGLRVFRGSAAQKLYITQNRMAHASELIDLIALHRLKFKEVPVTIKYTDYSLQKGQKLSNSVSIILELLAARFHK